MGKKKVDSKRSKGIDAVTRHAISTDGTLAAWREEWQRRRDELMDILEQVTTRLDEGHEIANLMATGIDAMDEVLDGIDSWDESVERAFAEEKAQ